MDKELSYCDMKDYEQYAGSVLDCTSKFNINGTIAYSSKNIISKPTKYPAYGDFPDSYMLRTYGKWWSKCESTQRPYRVQDNDELGAEDYIILKFDTPVIPTSVIIYEVFNPGAVVRIWGRSSNSIWKVLWEQKPRKCPPISRKFAPSIKKIGILINELRLDFNLSLLDYYASIDGVLLAGKYPHSELQRKIFSKHALDDYIPIQTHSPQLNDSIEDTERDLFETLPHELVLHIFQYLDLKSLCRCARVNKRFHYATLDQAIYKQLSFKKYWPQVNDDVLEIYSTRSRHLEKLDLSWCGHDGKITKKMIIKFLQQCCKNLTHLSMCHTGFDNNSILDVVSTLTDLTELRLHNYKTSLYGMLSLENLHNLVCLDLYSSSITQQELVCILKANPNLKHLIIDLCNSVRVLDSITATVSQHNRDLRTWSSWKTCMLTPAGVRALSTCPNLQVADLGWCLLQFQPEDCLERLAVGCKDLRRLILSGWRGISDHHLLPIIRSCKQLKELDLSGVMNISGDICERVLDSLTKLCLLDISFCKAIDKNKVLEWKIKYSHVLIKYNYDSAADD